MKQSQIKRKQQSQTGKVDPPAQSPATPHPGYAPDAALHAIKRHALEFVNPKELQVSPTFIHYRLQKTLQYFKGAGFLRNVCNVIENT